MAFTEHKQNKNWHNAPIACGLDFVFRNSYPPAKKNLKDHSQMALFCLSVLIQLLNVGFSTRASMNH